MRAWIVGLAAVATIALCGCAATKQEVSEQLGARYVGKNVDVLVSDFGPPSSAFRMNSGGMAYMWQLSNETNVVAGDGWANAKPYCCKVSVLASPTGVVTQLKTEDVSGTGGIVGALGVDIHGSLCAHKLGIPRQT